MSQVPSTQSTTAPAIPGPGLDPFDALVQDYWNSRCNLLQLIPNPETRSRVEALIDGRVVQRVNDDVPPTLKQGVAMSFASLPDTLAVFNLIRPFASQWADRFLHQAIPYIAIVYYRYIQAPDVQLLLEGWDAKDGVVATVLVAAGPWLALQGLAIVGFTASGIAAGSLAALWQSTIGNVVAGSLFSSLQSIGAVGALGGPLGILAGLTTAGAYVLYKRAVMPTAEERFNAMLQSLFQNESERAKFWASINV